MKPYVIFVDSIEEGMIIRNYKVIEPYTGKWAIEDESIVLLKALNGSYKLAIAELKFHESDGFYWIARLV